jgi:hypothetical protein
MWPWKTLHDTPKTVRSQGLRRDSARPRRWKRSRDGQMRVPGAISGGGWARAAVASGASQGRAQAGPWIACGGAGWAPTPGSPRLATPSPRNCLGEGVGRPAGTGGGSWGTGRAMQLSEAHVREGCAPGGPGRRRARRVSDGARGSPARRWPGAVGNGGIVAYRARSPVRRPSAEHAQSAVRSTEVRRYGGYGWALGTGHRAPGTSFCMSTVDPERT